MANIKYNPAYHDDWAWSLAIKGAIDTEIAEAFGVSVRTIHKWKKAHESFERALSAGKDSADAKVVHSLFERATGYSYTEEEKVVETDPKTGEIKPVKVRTIKKHVPPDVLAQMYWLNNRRTNEFKRNPENFVDTSVVYEIEDMDEVEADVYGSENKEEGFEPQEDNRLPLLGEAQGVHKEMPE